MTVTGFRGRLLAGAALGLGFALFSPTQAQAQCVVAPPGTPISGTVTCADTVTTNTTYLGVSPSIHRNYEVDTSTTAFTGTVTTGEIVSGHGLAFTNTVGGANTLNVVNNGTVQVDVGNSPSAGGTAALQTTAIGATNVIYSGTGSVINLGTGNGLGFAMNGTGDLTATVGGNITSGPGVGNATGDGIYVAHSGASGNIAVTTTTGTTIRADWVGFYEEELNAASTATYNLTNNSTILSLTGAPGTLDFGAYIFNIGLGSNTLVNNGTIGSATDRVVSVGVGNEILNAASTSALSVTGTGAIFSAGTGILANNLGTGTTTVNYTGAVNTTGATGVDVNGTAAATNVTLGAVTAATNAVDVTSTGAQTIALNGVTTGTAGSGLVSDTTGARTITVGSAGNVTGGTQAILLTNTGTASIGNSGIIGGAAATGALAINAAAAGATTVTNNAAGTINGRLTLSGFNDTFGNTGTWNTQGITDFGVGTDALTNNAAGIINLTGATTLANLETFTQNGRINLNTFVLTGPPIALNNAGFIDTSGSAGIAGFTTLNNSGTIDLAAGTFTVPASTFTNTGTVIADEGATTITGQTSFANSGTIDLQDGVANDVLTINSAFVGSGGSNVDIDFSGTASDRLVINGAASGSTAVDAQYLGGGFNLDGLLAIDTTTSTASSFVLGTVTGETPLVDVSLVRIGQDFFLVAAPTVAAFNPLVVPGFAMDLWYQSADEIFAETVKPATTVGLSFWGEGYVSRDRYGDDDDSVTIDGVEFDVDNRVKTKRHGVQGGVDYGFGGGRVGLSAGYAWADANGSGGANPRARGWNVGVYGQFGGLTGFHGEALLKHDRYDAEFEDGAFEGVDFDITSTGIDGSIGYRFGFGGMAMDAHAGISHVRTKIDDIGAFGFDYDIGNVTSTRGRAGLRAILGDSGWAPYIDATVYREFDGDGEVELFDGVNAYDLDTQGKGTWVRAELGLSGNNGPGPILAAWADFLDRKGIGLRAGWRFGGRVAEALPPPPPPVAVAPPPPPPPATQTCPDGSVILATDACPPPPPPPPPPPEPERG